ncbi:hypothetical protein PMG11_00380 [Penicillium brasilianum]|uniref:Zn(2)-C6 fungal-type domain-containing protein n=1 Tax=Penicillium brasilianum TaxID=104259 RepID=A0A0F7TCG1_PENBI|nr:hypothetical protein PMG11_00380 [Penicillium brasilianum]
MGGAPWRSDGCNTCRRRKVKCDLQRPHCARCLRGGHGCEGYERASKFIVHTFADQVKTGKEPICESMQFQFKKTAKDAPRPTKETSITVVQVNAQIRSQLFSIFVDSYNPSAPKGQVSFRFRDASNLFEALPSMLDGKNSQLLDRATSALASVFVGKKFKNDQMIHHGVELYNQAIHSFSRLISRQGLPVREVLCANVIFQYYEVINSTSGFSGWMAHMQGANAVVAQYGKSLERDQISIMLFRQLKLSNIFHAIGKSRSALYFCPMWQTLTSCIDGHSWADPVDEIIDILMRCTLFVEYIDNICSGHDTIQLMKVCHTLKHQTESWYARLKSTSPSPLYTTVPNEAEISRSHATKSLFPETYHFASIEIAEVHMLYWTASLIIYSLFQEIERREEFSDTTLLDPQCLNPIYVTRQGGSSPFMKNAELYTDQICRGVGYFVQPHMHILGGHNLLFPVSMAAQFFYRNGINDRYLWCQEVFSFLESLGLGLAHVLRGTPWSRYKSGSGLQY